MRSRRLEKLSILYPLISIDFPRFSTTCSFQNYQTNFRSSVVSIAQKKDNTIFVYTVYTGSTKCTKNCSGTGTVTHAELEACFHADAPDTEYNGAPCRNSSGLILLLGFLRRMHRTHTCLAGSLLTAWSNPATKNNTVITSCETFVIRNFYLAHGRLQPSSFQGPLRWRYKYRYVLKLYLPAFLQCQRFAKA